MVARQEGRAKPYGKGTVGGWTSERNEPSIVIFEAIARIAACDPWWLVWGQGTAPANALQALRPPPRDAAEQQS